MNNGRYDCSCSATNDAIGAWSSVGFVSYAGIVCSTWNWMRCPGDVSHLAANESEVRRWLSSSRRWIGMKLRASPPTTLCSVAIGTTQSASATDEGVDRVVLQWRVTVKSVCLENYTRLLLCATTTLLTTRISCRLSDRFRCHLLTAIYRKTYRLNVNLCDTRSACLKDYVENDDESKRMKNYS